ncbi:MAG: hypothetical protein M1371_10530 [Actinobacteria bacterium]|nr:hypothetical protein [Actinomycetota bacterium]
MALKGRIEQFNFIEVLTLAGAINRHDITILFSNDHDSIRLYLRDGKPLFGESGVAPEDYVKWLVESGVVRAENIAVLKEDGDFNRSEQLSILKYFADKGLVNMELLTTFTYEQTREVIMGISSWTSGDFEVIFEDHDFGALRFNPVEISSDVESEVAKARVRAKVMSDRSAISEEMVFDINPQFSNSIGEITLNPLQWRIISLVDGKKSLRYISRFLDASEDEIKSSLLDLLSRGLVEVVGEKVHLYGVKPGSEKVVLPFSPAVKEGPVRTEGKAPVAGSDVKAQEPEEVKPVEAVVVAGGEEEKGEEIVLGQNVKRDPNLSRRLIVKIIDSITDL